MVDSKVIEAFKLMWGSFPEPVMLIHKNREILAVNELCSNWGTTPGVKCIELGSSPEAHKGCMANEALATQTAKVAIGEFVGKEIRSYWVPVTGYPDIFLHFSIGAV